MANVPDGGLEHSGKGDAMAGALSCGADDIYASARVATLTGMAKKHAARRCCMPVVHVSQIYDPPRFVARLEGLCELPLEAPPTP